MRLTQHGLSGAKMNISSFKKNAAPYGWRWSDDETRELVPVCEEQEVLNIMMELRSLGETYQSISDELERRRLLKGNNHSKDLQEQK
jgi:hypothetical protein